MKTHLEMAESPKLTMKSEMEISIMKNCSTGTTGDETLRAYQEAVARIVEQAREEAGDDRYKLVKAFS